MIAYLGYLAGHEFISQVIGDAAFRGLVEAAWRGGDRTDIDDACERFDGLCDCPAEALFQSCAQAPYVSDRDGRQPEVAATAVGTIAGRLAKGQPVERLALGVAAWMVYAAGTDLKGKPITVQDPMAEELKRAGEGDAVSNFLALRRVFTVEVAESAEFREAVTRQYRVLREVGPVEAARRLA